MVGCGRDAGCGRDLGRGPQGHEGWDAGCGALGASRRTAVTLARDSSAVVRLIRSRCSDASSERVAPITKVARKVADALAGKEKARARGARPKEKEKVGGVQKARILIEAEAKQKAKERVKLVRGEAHR